MRIIQYDVEGIEFMRQNHRTRTGHGRTSSARAGAGVVVSSTVVALAAGMLPGTAAAAAAPAVASGIGTTSATTAAAPGSTEVRSLDVPATTGEVARGGSEVVALLEPTDTPTYGLVGVTWEPGTAAKDTVVWVRTRTGGTWGPWTHMGGCMCPACRASRPENPDSDVRVGTAPTWVGEADGVAVRVMSSSGRAPRDVSVETIEPDRAPLATGVGTRSSSGASTQRLPAGFPAMPDIVTRREWGADPALTESCSSPRYGSAARAVAVHHTVNSNSYSRSDSPAMMRSILAYHTQSQGWCDIGYNFVVDRYGTIFEGRRGGMRRPVRGAHAGDYNTDTVGVSMLGNFDVAPLTRRLKNAMVRLIGWRLGTSYMPARGRAIVPAGGVARIFGHRDVMSTACPGRYGYAFLPRLRQRVAAYTSRYDSPIRARSNELGGRVTGAVFEGERFARGGARTVFAKGAIFHKRGLGTHWLKGATRTAYTRFGGVAGALGYPRSEQRSTAVPGVFVVRFEGGTIFRVGKKRAYQVRGRILLRYGKVGGVDGRLGVPTSSMTRNGPRDKVTFEQGRIIHNVNNGKLRVIQP